jgi:transcription antitermination factor NusG
MSKEFFKAAGIRSLKTICQTMLSLITVGQAMTDINWLGIFSVSLVSGIVSLLTSVATGLPETEVNGQIILERNEEGLPQVKLNLDNVKPGDKLIFIDKTEDEK